VDYGASSGANNPIYTPRDIAMENVLFQAQQ
jgi:hypothetical protein